MALFKILKGSSTKIDTKTTPFHEGYAYFTPDDGGFYIDVVEGEEQKRVRLTAEIAERLKDPISIEFSGDISGTYTFDGPPYLLANDTQKLATDEGEDIVAVQKMNTTVNIDSVHHADTADTAKTADSAKTAATATSATSAKSAETSAKLTTPHKITVDVSSETVNTFDGSADLTTGITGAVPIKHGGTGATDAQAALAALGAAAKPSVVSVSLKSTSWASGLEYSATVAGVSADESAQLIIPVPLFDSQQEYLDSGMRVVGQSESSLKFKCDNAPASDLNVNIVIIPL